MPTHSESSHPMRQLIGLSAALATPFDAKGDIDWPRFAAHASGLLDGGMKVVTAFGTTGEGASIGTRARAELFERMAAGGIASGQIVECIYGPASDDAAWFAVNSLVTDVFVLTTTFTTYLTRPVTSGTLTAIGEVVNEGRTQWLAQAVVYDDEQREVGRGSGTFVKSRSPLTPEIGYD